MDKEDGEMSDDNAMLVDEDLGVLGPNSEDCTVLFKAEKNGIIVEKLEKVDASKLEERAKRFGLNLTGNRIITQRQIDELYSNCGIESGNERHFRFDAINLHGVDGLTTKEIFQYLEDYKPVSLEWVDDTSCNVVCQDHISAALALLVHSREIRDENIKNMLAEKSNHHWREGMPHPKKDLILIRFATNADKKASKKKPEPKKYDEYNDQSMDPISKNPWGDLCKSWGVYDHQEVFQRKFYYNDDDQEEDQEPHEPEKIVRIKNKSLAMRLGKRRLNNDIKTEKSDHSSDSDSDWKVKSKVPRMRMHADDEESRQKKKLISQHTKEIENDTGFAPLSIEIDNSQRYSSQRKSTVNNKLSEKFKVHSTATHKQKSGIQSRLGEKVIRAEEKYSSDESSEGSDSYTKSKVHKINSTVRSTANSVWSRLDTKTSSGAAKDLRQKLKSRKHKPSDDVRDRMPSDDLRERLGKSKQSNLMIEIDNNYAQDS